MIIDFNNIKETVIPKFYNGEKELSAQIHVDEKNKILCGKLVAGASIGVHTHEKGSEIIYILKGTGKVLYDGQYEEVRQGLCHYCPKGHSHSLINDSNDDLLFFAVVAEQ